jgi:hypothetical protein
MPVSGVLAILTRCRRPTCRAQRNSRRADDTAELLPGLPFIDLKRFARDVVVPVSEQVFRTEFTMTQGEAETWWLEFENGGRSTAFATEAEAWAALVDLQSPQTQTSPLYSRVVCLVSSDRLRFAFSAKTA